MGRPRRGLDFGAVLAVAWLLIAIGLTVIFGAQLGIRGWGWLIAHHLLCAAGVTHELRRHRERTRAARALPPPPEAP